MIYTNQNITCLMGAIDIETNRFTSPLVASKEREYRCCKCSEEVIFRNGLKNIQHFSHKPNSKCNHYATATETDIHINAKHKLVSILNNPNNIGIQFIQNCKCKSALSFLEIKKGLIAEDEVHFEYDLDGEIRGGIADVAYMNDNGIEYIIEVLNTSKTSENARPEPWNEVSAFEVLKQDVNEGILALSCHRIVNKCSCIIQKQIDIREADCLRKKQLLATMKRLKENNHNLEDVNTLKNELIRCSSEMFNSYDDANLKCQCFKLRVKTNFSKPDTVKYAFQFYNKHFAKYFKEEHKTRQLFSCFQCYDTGEMYASDGVYLNCVYCRCIECGGKQCVCDKLK